MDAIHVINGTVIVQNSSGNDVLNILVSIVTAIILGIGLFLTRKEINNTKKAIEEEQKIRYVQLLNDLDRDLTEHEDKFYYAKTVDDVYGYAIGMINALDKIVHLYIKEAIKFETVDYFEDLFLFGLSLEEWLVKNEFMTQDEVLTSNWKELNEFCSRNGFRAIPEEQLPILAKFDQMIINEKKKKAVSEIQKEIENLQNQLAEIKKEVKKTKK
jgi:phosphopantetheine adenylyltransferase